jgi:hypothetical protein
MLFEAMSALIGQCAIIIVHSSEQGGTYERNPTFQGYSLQPIFTSRTLSGFFIINRLNLHSFQQYCFPEGLQSRLQGFHHLRLGAAAKPQPFLVIACPPLLLPSPGNNSATINL